MLPADRSAVAAVGDTAQPTPAARFRGGGCRLLLLSPGTSAALRQLFLMSLQALVHSL